MYINNINNNNNDNNNSNNSNNKILIIITNTTKTKRHTASTIFPSISLYWELCLSTIFSNQSSLNLISTFTDFAVVEWRSLLENYFQKIYYHILIISDLQYSSTGIFLKHSQGQTTIDLFPIWRLEFHQISGVSFQSETRAVYKDWPFLKDVRPLDTSSSLPKSQKKKKEKRKRKERFVSLKFPPVTLMFLYWAILF